VPTSDDAFLDTLQTLFLLCGWRTHCRVKQFRVANSTFFIEQIVSSFLQWPTFLDWWGENSRIKFRRPSDLLNDDASALHSGSEGFHSRARYLWSRLGFLNSSCCWRLPD
jgi:hypothetical protein